MKRRFEGDCTHVEIETGTHDSGKRWVTLSFGDEWYSIDEWCADSPDEVVALRGIATAMAEAADYLEGKNI